MSNITVKRFKRVMCFILAFILMFGNAYFVPPVVTQAATVTYATASTKQDNAYAFQFEMKEEYDSESIPFGDSNQALNYVRGDIPANEYTRWVCFANPDNKGKIGCLYTNVGLYEIDGVERFVDLKITVTNWGQTYTNRSYTQLPGGYKDYDDDPRPPIIQFNKSNIGVNLNGVEWVDVDFQFYRHGENIPVNNIKGHVTLCDLDDLQEFSVVSGIAKSSLLNENNHISVQGDKFVSEKELTEDQDKEGWVPVFFDGTFKVRFHQSTYANSDTYSTKRGADGAMYGSHFGFVAETIGYFEMNAPEKRVGNVEDTFDEMGKHESISDYFMMPNAKTPDLVGGAEYQYIIKQKLYPNEGLKNFVIKDKIHDSLIIDSASKVQIKKQTADGLLNVTNQFDISVNNHMVTATAKPEFIGEKDNFENKVYYICIIARRDPDKPQLEDMLPNSNGYSVSNQAEVAFDWDYSSVPRQVLKTNKSYVGYELTPVTDENLSIEKRVGPHNVSWYDADKHMLKNISYRINDYEQFDYLIKSKINGNPNSIKEYVIKDTLEECLDIDNESKVSVVDKNGNLVTSRFNIDISEDGKGSKTVTVAATDTALSYKEFYDAEYYMVRLVVHRKRTTDVRSSMKEWLGSDGFTFYIPNKSSVRVVGAGPAGDEVLEESNESWVFDKIRSEISIEKTVDDYDGHEVGDEITYAVKVSQTRQDGYAVDVETWDTSLPEGLKIVPGTIKVVDSHLSEGVLANVVPMGTNGWKATCPRMMYGDSFVVEFKAKADERVNGRDTVNTAYATAKNFLVGDVEQTVSDTAEVWVNTPELVINKFSDRYEYEVGDTVDYTVIIKNTNDYTVAHNLVVKDISLPQGLKLKAEEGSISVKFSPDKSKDYVEYPTPDGTTTIAKKDIANVVKVTDNTKNTWKVESKYLSSNTILEIHFYCEATEDVNGIECVNKASVVADNVAKDEGGKPIPSWDDAKVYTNTVDLTIEKTANNYEWQIGDKVNYNITVKNTDSKPGTIARNIVISDISIPEGLMLESLDDVVITGVPSEITNKVEGPPDVVNQLDELHYNSTEVIDNQYTIEPQGTGFVVKIPNLPQGESVSIDFPCTATTISDGNSWEWINNATVTATNQRGHTTEEDDAEVYINTAVLSINKSMTNKYYNPDSEDYDNRTSDEFRVGEEVEYTLTVRNVMRNSIARNVVVSDVSLPKGLTLIGEPEVGGYNTLFNNPISGTEGIPNKVDVDFYKETEQLGFTYETNLVENADGSSGFTITIPNLPCTEGDILNPEWNQPLVITYHCRVDEKINGDRVINTAKVKADNGSEKQDSENIWVNSPKLQVTKKSDRDHYKLGDVITYEVVATQDEVGTIARNVVFDDILLTDGVKLQKSSIVLMDENGLVQDNDSYEVDIYNDHFSVRTKRNLVCPNGNYTNYDLDVNDSGIDGGAYNTQGITKEKKMTLEYQVVAISDDLAGKDVKNEITINSDENIPDKDDCVVSLNGPILNIEKFSDKESYHVGEEGIYKLVIKQLRENLTALDVKITDELKVKGAVIKPDSLMLELNNKVFKPKSIEVTDTGFTIDTGLDIEDSDKIEIVYVVQFEDPSLHNKTVNNVAKAWGSNTPEETQENVVKVTDLNPKLSIEKTSDKNEYEIGETGHYTVVVKQERKNAVARNVIIKDELQIEGARIQKDTIKIQNSLGTVLDRPEIDANYSRYTIHTGADLQYDDYFVVTYDVLFEADYLSGKDILNIARATADNAEAVAKNDVVTPITVGNSLTALKTCTPDNNSVVKNGSQITYSITVENTSASNKTNVLVKDKVPELTKFSNIVDQPGVDGKLINISGSDYAAFIINDLPARSTKTVQFVVNVVGATESDMIVNIAQVRETVAHIEDFSEETWASDRFRNTNETVHFLDTAWAVDTNTVAIKNAGLEINKSSDKTEYNVGDKGTYTLEVKNTKKGSVSKNVYIEDYIETRGAEIVYDSFDVYGTDGKIVRGLQPQTVDKRSFALETGMDLGYNETIKVVYEVSFANKDLEGKAVYNLAITRDDSTKPGEEPSDDNEVIIGKADIDISKSSDRYEYNIGETARYTLEVTTNSKEQSAKDVVITDELGNTDADLDGSSIEIKNGDGLLVRNADISYTGNTFRIDTHNDLSYGDKFILTYKVVMNKPTLVGHEVKNIAKTWGTNTDKVNDDNTIIITEKKATDGPENPTETPTQKPTDIPEETVKPTETPEATPTPTPEGKPVLNIKKSANKITAKVGDTVHYIVTITNDKSDSTAKLVSFTDKFLTGTDCIAINSDSIVVKVDDEVITPYNLSSGNGITQIETGYDLGYGETMKVEYDAVVSKDTSSSAKNMAMAKASNTDSVSATYTVNFGKTTVANTTTTTTIDGKTVGAANTGDERPIALVGMLALIACVGAVSGLTGYRKQGKTKKK